MHKYALTGCRSKPLASYLKAVAVLRLVSEQTDSQAKGWWEGDRFFFRSKLDENALAAFFCDEYSPTPVVAPWNGGSGFYLGDATKGMDAIESSKQSRFAGYRDVISAIKAWPEIPSFDTVDDVRQMLRVTREGMQQGNKRDEIDTLLNDVGSPGIDTSGLKEQDLVQLSLSEVEALSQQQGNADYLAWRAWWGKIKKARTKCNTIKRNENKKVILPLCRARLPESTLEWLDAVYSLQIDGKAFFNPALGTGGNEGRFELSNNFMQQVTGLFIDNDPDRTGALFLSSIFNTVSAGLMKAKIGQYDPGRAGGYNQGTGVETKDFKINPWDFILTIEGALLLASAVARRNPTAERSHFTSPFTVLFSSVGFSSSTYQETGRKELWLPLWHNPASYAEVRHLFGEGRSSIGRRVAETGIEFSRAVGTLGVDRGIEAFERYAFLERRGLSYVALPAGRIKVRYRPSLELLSELDPIITAVDRFMRLFQAVPATFQSARQNIDEAIFTCTQKSDPYSFSGLIRAVGNIEKTIALRDRSKKPVLTRPLFGLSPQWITYCDDGSPDMRIAASLASIHSTGKVGPLRSNMAGVDHMNPRRWGQSSGEHHWIGNSFAERLSGVLMRRLMDAERKSAPCVPIEAEIPISPYDAMSYLRGECDDIKIEELLWGFSLIDWKKFGLIILKRKWDTPLTDQPLSRTWAILKLLHTPHKVRNAAIKREPRISHFLVAGRIKDACDVAVHRLRVSEVQPYRVTYDEKIDPVRLLSSLLIPVKEQWKLESLVLERQPKTTE